MYFFTEVYGPAIYDDGDPSADNPGDLKIFLDPSEPERAIRARWGCARFAHHQNCQLCTNAFDEGGEPVRDDIQCTHADVMVMINPMFSARATMQDKMAVVKRAVTIVFGIRKTYLRFPSASTAEPVHTFSYWPNGMTPDLLAPSGIEKLRAFRGGSTEPPTTDAADRQWQYKFMCTVIQGEPLPRLIYMTVTELDEDGCLVKKEHIDDKPDFELAPSRPQLLPGAAGSSTDFMGADLGSGKRPLDGDRNREAVAPSSREMMPPPPIPARPAAKRLRMDDPEVDSQPLDERDLLGSDAARELDLDLANLAGFVTSASQDNDNISTIFSSSSQDPVGPDAGYDVDLEQELLDLMENIEEDSD